jgi:hypothetical protein
MLPMDNEFLDKEQDWSETHLNPENQWFNAIVPFKTIY